MSVNLAWRAEGSPAAPPLVLLHSLGSDRTMWDPQAAALAERRQLIRVDLRGHGRSPAPPGPYSLEDLASDVLRVADMAGASRFDLCGLSLGGQLALWIAAHEPARVRRLVACATAPRIGNSEGWQARIDAVHGQGMGPIADLAIERFFSPAFQSEAPAEVEAAREILRRTKAEGYAGCCAALRDADLRGELGAITAPSLLIAGQADVSTPPECLHAAAEEIRQAQVEVEEIPGAGHLLNIEAPERVTALILAHLDDAG
ncbi:3-oxoadipate enol-lactonase [Pseudenhygromyxa sp. WMMC2535]|uniref:3-oxoadipate enol-lactonase n=1 Tax=Pseudenhygromyxa sp. WMMC2535 TaxID=2712867 RepID=UPI001552F702|nr:3-oxoadipate enol-lactonase [Pseudenhygromyxa sp. WMMC2535]